MARKKLTPSQVVEAKTSYAAGVAFPALSEKDRVRVRRAVIALVKLYREEMTAPFIPDDYLKVRVGPICAELDRNAEGWVGVLYAQDGILLRFLVDSRKHLDAKAAMKALVGYLPPEERRL